MRSLHRFGFFLFLATVFSSANFAAARDCDTDAKFVASGWAVHNSAQFSSLSQSLVDRFHQEQSDYVFDTEGPVDSSVTERFVFVRSYDRLSTPQSEMYGDFILITDLRSGRLVEVRWYAEGNRQLIYDATYQDCASSIFPWAVNALF